jgi:short-subunit dehydrogenase
MLTTSTSAEGLFMSKKHEVDAGWAVVTGASSGLGALFAEKLAQRGLPLVLAGRDEARLTEVRQQVQRLAPGVEVELVVGDLGSRAGVESLLAVLNGRVVDVLVNNAGFGTYGRLSEVDADRDHDLIAVNVDTLVRLTHAVLPGMLERGRGQILNVASTIAFQPRRIRPPTGRRRRSSCRSVRRCGRDKGHGRHGDRVVPRAQPHRLC